MFLLRGEMEARKLLRRLRLKIKSQKVLCWLRHEFFNVITYVGRNAPWKYMNSASKQTNAATQNNNYHKSEQTKVPKFPLFWWKTWAGERGGWSTWKQKLPKGLKLPPQPPSKKSFSDLVGGGESHSGQEDWYHHTRLHPRKVFWKGEMDKLQRITEQHCNKVNSRQRWWGVLTPPPQPPKNLKLKSQTWLFTAFPFYTSYSVFDDWCHYPFLHLRNWSRKSLFEADLDFSYKY